MPRTVPLPGFAGGSNRLWSPNASVARSINLFPERTAPDGKVPQYLRGTAGLRPFAQFSDTNCRSLFYQDGRCFAVVGTTYGEIFDDGTTTAYGSVMNDALPATQCSNGTAGNQNFITAGGLGYIFALNTNTLSADLASFVPGFPTTVNMGEFMDGYFLVLLRNSRQFQWSALEDGLSWDVLDIAQRSEGSDNIAFLKRNHRELWLVGTQTGEVWYDQGDPLTPFAPIQGVFLEMGCVAPFSAVRAENTLFWLNQDERGGGMVVRANGYTPDRISTYAIDLQIQSIQGVLNGAESFAHQEQGHLFYWTHLDGGMETTPVLDSTEELWSERAMWDSVTATWSPHIARAHCWAFEKHLVGTRDSGIIYELSPNVYDDSLI